MDDEIETDLRDDVLLDKKNQFVSDNSNMLKLDIKNKTFTVYTDNLNQNCFKGNHGFITFKFSGNGQLYDFKRKIEKLLQYKLGHCHDERELFNELVSKNIHLTFFRTNREDLSDLNSKCLCKTQPCPSRNFILIDKSTKRKKKCVSDFYVLVFENKYFWCKIINVKFFCKGCGSEFSTSGHTCRNICKKIRYREFKKLYDRKIKVDVFYDIETFLEKNEDNEEIFIPGLICFSLNISVSDTEGPPVENALGEFKMYALQVEQEVNDLLQSLNLKNRTIRKGNIDHVCYEIIDENLDGSIDIMIEFLQILELIMNKVHCMSFIPIDKRVSLISFNGSKFDDILLFSSLVKKGGMCDVNLDQISILERGSKLLCISFILVDKENKVNTQFRTQDLRSFLLTGSLDANAKSFNVPCDKLCFPHTLIDALRRNEVPEIMEEFPEYKYFEGFGGFLCSKEEYEKLKSENPGPYDIKETWSIYCSYDVVVLKLTYKNFFTNISMNFFPIIKKKFDATHKLTLPSLTNALCYLYMMNKFFNGNNIYTPTGDFLRVTYQAIFGGHCQANARCKFLPNPETKTFYDFNGEYSGCMTGLFPYGEIHKMGDEEREYLNENMDELFKGEGKKFNNYKPFLVYCKMKAPQDPKKHYCLPNIPERDNKNCLIFTNRSKEGFYYSKDIYNAIHYYDYKVEILDNPYNHTYASWEYLFKDYVEFCQRLKIEGKKEKNSIKENIGKLFGNALYGFQIKKPDRDQSKIVMNQKEFCQYRHLECKGFIKITHIICRSDIINANCILTNHRRNFNDLIIEDEDEDGFILYNSSSTPSTSYWLEEESKLEFPVLLKFSKLDPFELECNTLPQIGVDVLCSSRLLNAELYFDMLITEEEKNLPIEERLPIVYYTDTDSFMVEKWRIKEKWYSGKNVTFNQETFKYEPYGKNEFKDKNNEDFIPKQIILAGKKLYCCIGPNLEIKCASKGVDSYHIVRESLKTNSDQSEAVNEFIKKFEKLLDNETVIFKQDSMQKNYNTYSIRKQSLERQLKLTDLNMIPYKTENECTYYRPYNDNDDVMSFQNSDETMSDIFVL